ncbi:hypothetical protein A9Q99_01895 [Gammaproteobacteria bacterium 45_16_T64]|nr:hypothetical protein A9Q99_01895 [Gammaproteobacteria bacterium 45_16_T64]
MNSKEKKLTTLQLLQNVLAALIGIQSEAKVKETQSKITKGQILLCALILLGLFLSTVITAVYLVITHYT